MKNLLFLFLIIFLNNSTISDSIIIEYDHKTYNVADGKKLELFINDFLSPDFDLQKTISAKLKYDKDYQFHYVDITGYDSQFLVKKIVIPISPKKDATSNTFTTLGCSHHCDFLDTTLPAHNYEWEVSSPCKSQTCGNAYSCYVIFY